MTHLTAQVDALWRAFLGRFFESELTAGQDDLKVSFFWLIAALAMPGMALPWLMSFNWQMVTMLRGWEALRIESLSEKTFYLGYSMIAAGIVTTVAWSSLLPDRRDTLILGALPVKPSVVVGGKLAALAAYLGLVAVGTHAVGALFWGTLLGNNAPLLFTVRSVVAHFVAAAAITMTTCVAVAAIQGLALAVAGPRLFARLSTVLQVALVGAIALALAWLPIMAMATPHTLYGGRRALPWILSLPPLWFVGLYEWILGNEPAVLTRLAGRALAAILLSASVAVVAYTLAYRRLMVSVVETGNRRRNPLARLALRLLVLAAGRQPPARAATEFFVATLARVERQRFVIAMSLGLALAWGLVGLYAYEPSPRPQAPIMALPIAMMMFLLVALRIASSLPGDVRAGWLFDVHDIDRKYARRAIERVMFLVGVVPLVALSSPVYWRLWGGGVALTHTVVMTALGIAVIQLLIWRCNSMPCGLQWAPARFDLGRRWPLHAGFFLLVVIGVPRLETVLFGRPIGAAIFVANLVLLAAVLRYASARHQIVPTYEEVDPVAGVLRLG